MTKKLLFISICSILATFALGWETALRVKKFDELENLVTHAIPVIRFEKFDDVRNALIIGLFNPGTLPIEINRTKLIYKANHTIASAGFVTKEYGDKALVLDPGDTILVPLAISVSAKSSRITGNYWGHLDFRIPGQIDFYSVHHPFSFNQKGDIKNPVKK